MDSLKADFHADLGKELRTGNFYDGVVLPWQYFKKRFDISWPIV